MHNMTDVGPGNSSGLPLGLIRQACGEDGSCGFGGQQEATMSGDRDFLRLWIAR